MIGSAPVLGVSDFVAIFNQSLDMLYPEVVISGELSNFRISKNMWVYFDLKDEQASVRFFGTVRSLPGPLEDGMMLQVYGRPHLHSKFGFSIQIDAVQAVGEGTINRAQKLLAMKLEAEGLFAEERKRSIPYPPQKIAVISSSESAGYGDFSKIVDTRWPQLTRQLFDVQVQGADAPAQIIRALESANQLVDIDAIVLIRGGGSRDDLAAFDHEQVVRAVAASRAPTIVAIGHERDLVLSELAADVRASTPSNAAELLVPSINEEAELLQQARHRLDSLLSRLASDLRREVALYRESLNAELSGVRTRGAEYIVHARTLMNAYDPKMPLSRGYALVHSQQGEVLRTAVAAGRESSVIIEFKDGKLVMKQEKERT